MSTKTCSSSAASNLNDNPTLSVTRSVADEHDAAVSAVIDAAIDHIKTLRGEELELIGRSKATTLEATVRAYHIGRLISIQVDRGYGKGGMAGFAKRCGFSLQTAYNYLYLWRGAVAETTIREYPELSRSYFQVLGETIDLTKDFLGAHIRHSLITIPIMKKAEKDANTDDLVPDVERLKEIGRLLKQCRNRIKNDLRIGYFLNTFETGEDDVSPYMGFTVRDGDEERFNEASVLIAQLFRDISGISGLKGRMALNLEGLGLDTKEVLGKDEVTEHDNARTIQRKYARRRLIQESASQSTPATRQVAHENVIHGRAEEVLQDRQRFPERLVDVVIADPPYSKQYYKTAWREHLLIEHDAEKTVEQAAALVGKVAGILVQRRIIKRRFTWFSFCPMDFVHVFLPPILDAFRGLPIVHQVLVWDKKRTPKTGGHQFFSRQAEAILYVSVNRPLGTRGEEDEETQLHSSLLRERATDQDGDNFFWKPKSLLKRLISLSTYDLSTDAASQQVILDPFAGSGSTGVAAIECNRDFRLIESHKTQHQTAQAEILKALKSKADN